MKTMIFYFLTVTALHLSEIIFIFSEESHQLHTPQHGLQDTWFQQWSYWVTTSGIVLLRMENGAWLRRAPVFWLSPGLGSISIASLLPWDVFQKKKNRTAWRLCGVSKEVCLLQDVFEGQSREKEEWLQSKEQIPNGIWMKEVSSHLCCQDINGF